MATKRYKLVFEVTATKMNLEIVFSTLAMASITPPKGFLEIKILREDEEPLQLKISDYKDFNLFDKLIGFKKR